MIGGNNAVGKTSLVMKYIQGYVFEKEDYKPTVIEKWKGKREVTVLQSDIFTNTV